MILASEAGIRIQLNTRDEEWLPILATFFFLLPGLPSERTNSLRTIRVAGREFIVRDPPRAFRGSCCPESRLTRIAVLRMSPTEKFILALLCELALT